MASPPIRHHAAPGELDLLTLARARRGDGAALTALVKRYQRPVFALVSRMMVGQPELTEDLAQESMLKVIRGIARFDPEGPSRLSSWVLTIATRTCIDALRRQRDAFQKQLQLRTFETRELRAAEAKVKIAKARLVQARLAVEAARLRGMRPY